MPAEIITAEELIEYGERTLPMSDFSEAQITESIDRATDRIRQAALNDYTPDSFELLTVATAPAEMREISLALAMSVLTRGDAARSHAISDAADDAAKRLGYIAAGRTYYDKSPNAVLVKLSAGAGSSVSSRAPSERVFDRSNTSQKYNDRDGAI